MLNTPGIMSIILLAAIAGLASSLLGGMIVIFVGHSSKKFLGLSFSFAAAVLITVVFIDFIPHAIGHGHYHTAINPYTGLMYQYWYQHSGAGIWLTIAGVIIGAGIVFFLSSFDKYEHEHIHGVLPHNEYCSHTSLTINEKRRVVSIAFPIAFAIILHDFPKGLAIGSTGSVISAIAIGLSCIPEGMSIAIPLDAGGTKRWKTLGVCGLAGMATIAGAAVGYLVGGINVYLSGIMFAVAAGCIFGTVFSEIMPLATEYSGRTKLKLPIMMVGVLLVITLNYFFHGAIH